MADPHAQNLPGDMVARVLDQLPGHIAVVDRLGNIVLVNLAWKRFAQANVFAGTDAGLGNNYLDTCRQARGDCAEEAQAALAGIESVLAGTCDHFSLEYPCHAPDQQRWFRMMVTPLVLETGRIFAVILHLDITERKSIENRLADTHRRFVDTLNGVGDLFVAFDRDWNFTFLNRQAAAFTGHRPEELLGRNLWQVFPQAAAGPFQSELFEAVRTRQERRFEAYYEERGLWYEHRAFPHDQGLSLYSTDITEGKRAAERLRESEERLRFALEASRIGVWEWDLVRNRMHCSSMVGPLHGREIGATPIAFGQFLEWIHPEDRERMREVVAMGFRGKPSRPMDYRVLWPDGKTRWLSARGELQYEEGRPVRLMGACWDVTARREAEEEQRRLAAIVESSQDAILAKRPDGTILSWNAGAERLFGHPAAEVVGKSVLLLVPPERHDEEKGILKRLEQGKRIDQYETVRVARDGRLLHVSLSLSPILDDDGKAVAGSCIMRDISQRRQLEEQIRQSQKMEAIGQLAGGVAHDFNNLLTIINGYGEILLDQMPRQDPAHHLLREIRRAGERAAGLTRQLLAFSRKQILQPVVLHLNDVVQDLEKMLRRLIGEDIDLVTYLDPELDPVRADPGQIEQVIMNLAVNARDAMPRGGRLTIETRRVDLDQDYARNHLGVHAGRHALLAVSDDGVGMPREVQARIFEPFFTTKEVGKGTGLGLATVHGIVKQSEGHIEVYSEPGRGTTFKILLPAIESTAPRTPEEAAERPALRGSESILLVEDEEAVRRLAALALETQGYRVAVAGDGEEALRVAADLDDKLDLVVTDVVMPRLGGPALVDALRAAQPGLKVLFMSGYTDEAVVRHGVLDSSTPFLQKPFSPLTLTRKVRDVLDGPDPREETPAQEHGT